MTLNFIPIDGLIDEYAVNSKNSTIGTIHWDIRFKQFCFYSNYRLNLSITYLEEILNFMKKLKPSEYKLIKIR